MGHPTKFEGQSFTPLIRGVEVHSNNFSGVWAARVRGGHEREKKTEKSCREDLVSIQTYLRQADDVLKAKKTQLGAGVARNSKSKDEGMLLYPKQQNSHPREGHQNPEVVFDSQWLPGIQEL